MDKSSSEKKIQIPLSLFNRIVELMDSLDVPEDDPVLLVMFNAVKHGLRAKRISMLHRSAFSDVVCAGDETQRGAALENYVKTKQFYKNGGGGV